MWALLCAQLKGFLKTGDLLRSPADRRQAWDPARDTDRARINTGIAYSLYGEIVGAKVELDLDPPSATKRERSKSAGDFLWFKLRDPYPR